MRKLLRLEKFQTRVLWEKHSPGRIVCGDQTVSHDTGEVVSSPKQFGISELSFLRISARRPDVRGGQTVSRDTGEVISSLKEFGISELSFLMISAWRPVSESRHRRGGQQPEGIRDIRTLVSYDQCAEARRPLCTPFLLPPVPQLSQLLLGLLPPFIPFRRLPTLSLKGPHPCAALPSCQTSGRPVMPDPSRGGNASPGAVGLEQSSESPERRAPSPGAADQLPSRRQRPKAAAWRQLPSPEASPYRRSPVAALPSEPGLAGMEAEMRKCGRGARAGASSARRRPEGLSRPDCLHAARSPRQPNPAAGEASVMAARLAYQNRVAAAR
uniref:Uncharacterized protein n=1 Tax=Sphaerodactylus townsendi TaxID=933632 RepID=A0ACB8F1E7_9SAUR